MAKKDSWIEDFEDFEDEEDEEEPPLTEEELAKFKALLLAKRLEVQEKLRKHLEEAIQEGDERSADEVDLASKITDQAYLMRLADKERKLLAQIEHALKKFEDHTYGICEGTGEQISRRRLELRPWTRYSVEYKNHLERMKLH